MNADTSLIHNRSAGFSLIELMLAIALGLVVLGSVTSVLVSNLVTNSSNMQIIRLDQDLRAVMLMMTRDIRRAGSRDSDTAIADIGTGTENNNFDGIRLYNVGSTTPVYDDEDIDGGGVIPAIATPPVAITANGNCILFRYDIDSDGAFAANSDEFGYRLNSTIGAVQTRNGGAAVAGCDIGTGAWQAITDDNAITITTLNFAVTNTPVVVPNPAGGTSTTWVREIAITLEGSTDIGNGETAVRRIDETVRVRTDDFDV